MAWHLNSKPPVKRPNPSWLDKVSLTDELVYQYQVRGRTLNEVLIADLHALKNVKQVKFRMIKETCDIMLTIWYIFTAEHGQRPAESTLYGFESVQRPRNALCAGIFRQQWRRGQSHERSSEASTVQQTRLGLRRKLPATKRLTLFWGTFSC